MTDYFICPNCYKKILIREKKTQLCLECFIPKIISSIKCQKCGKILIEENLTNFCLNKNLCGA